MPADFVEVDAITPIVRALRTEGQCATGKNLCYFLSDFLNLIVPAVAPDVEDLVVDGIGGGIERT